MSDSDREIELYRQQFLAEMEEPGGEGAEAETILAVTSDRVYSVPIAPTVAFEVCTEHGCTTPAFGGVDGRLYCEAHFESAVRRMRGKPEEATMKGAPVYDWATHELGEGDRGRPADQD